MRHDIDFIFTVLQQRQAMSAVIDGLINSFQKNMEYGQRLVADLSPEQWILQPDGERDQPVNHPAWTFSHLNIYLPVIFGVIKGESFDDPKGHKYGMDSATQQDASLYPGPEQIVAEWTNGHTAVTELLGGCDNSLFESPVVLERWAGVFKNAGVCLPYLMLNHENQHLGQISAWRRVLGLPSV